MAKHKGNKRFRKTKIFLKLILALAIVLTAYFLLSDYLASRPKLAYAFNADSTAAIAYPDTQFAVISDLHVYDPALGSEGAAFEKTMQSDRKLLLDSQDLLDYAIDQILASDAQFVLVSGDLTKDGERVNHDIAAQKLSRLTDADLKVFVVPGNHDVNNPDAAEYIGNNAIPAENITAADFAEIYAGFGYGDALYRDANTLSYVAEVQEGLWVLALDANRSAENRPGVPEIVGGKFTQPTIDWVESMLLNAQTQGKAVIVLMHHGIVEHWQGQSKLHADYLVEDYYYFGKLLASYGARIAFTGHYHAHDITRGNFEDGSFIYDVMTGSLITAPCPIRFCSIANNRFSVQSDTIVEDLHPDTDFAERAHAFVKATVELEAKATLKKYGVTGKDADIIASAVGDAFAAHYAGDENAAKRVEIDKSELSLWGRIVLATQGYVLDGLWADLQPGDYNVQFSLGG